MRTFAHDTALPGGKYELGDIDPEGTAVSVPEKNRYVSIDGFLAEKRGVWRGRILQSAVKHDWKIVVLQIGLPIDRNKVRKLCILDPFLTGNSLIVTP